MIDALLSALKSLRQSFRKTLVQWFPSDRSRMARRASHRSMIPSGMGRIDFLERRALLSVYLPIVGDYDGNGSADIAEYRVNDDYQTQSSGDATMYIRTTGRVSYSGFTLGLSGIDKPVAGDFDGDGKTDVAAYGFLNNISYGDYYGSNPSLQGAQPFPNGSGRFIYLPSSGNYPLRQNGAVNGAMGFYTSKAIVVNIGGPGDVPALGDYDGDGKTDFAVYEPSKSQFLYYPSSTFNINADPSISANAPKVLAFGRSGAVPASADYLGTGKTQFALYDASSGTFYVRPDNGGATITMKLGGPGDVPVSADFEHIGKADFAVYDPSTSTFYVKPSFSSIVQVIQLGQKGDTPAVGNFTGTGALLGTFTPSTDRFHYIQFPGGITTLSIADPDAIGVKRTDDYAILMHNEYLNRPTSPDVMLLGDSITYRYPIYGSDSYYGRLSQFNVGDDGVAADTTQNLLWRIQNGELKYHPRLAVVEIGTNDVTGRSAAEISHTLKVIVDAIHAASPTSSILLLNVLPRGRLDSADSPSVQAYYQSVNDELRQLNQQFIPLIAPPLDQRKYGGYAAGVYSLDLRSVFSFEPTNPDDYYANTTLFSDLLHPTNLGYELLTSNLVGPIRTMLGRSAAPGDFDGDGKTDIGVYSPGTGTYTIKTSLNSTTLQIPFGIAGAGNSLLATGDYDGDGRADFAVYQPATGGFQIFSSLTSQTAYFPFGIPGTGQSLPAPGDYDGDGKTDMAVYEPSRGGFSIYQSRYNAEAFIPFGLAGAGQSLPVPGDYDGDGVTDLAVYEPATGVYLIRPSTGGGSVKTIQFGMAGSGLSVPMPGDYDGDGKTDLAVYLPTIGRIAYRPSSGGADRFVAYGVGGLNNSVPAPGDYDGDGKTDPAIYGPTVGGIAYRSSRTGADFYTPFGIRGYGQSIPVTNSLAQEIGNATPGNARPAGSLADLSDEVPKSSKPRPHPVKIVPGPIAAKSRLRVLIPTSATEPARSKSR